MKRGERIVGYGITSGDPSRDEDSETGFERPLSRQAMLAEVRSLRAGDTITCYHAVEPVGVWRIGDCGSVEPLTAEQVDRIAPPLIPRVTACDCCAQEGGAG